MTTQPWDPHDSLSLLVGQSATLVQTVKFLAMLQAQIPFEASAPENK
jgi:hypothetical protein